MSWLTFARAISVRVLFAIHGLVSIWRLYVVTQDARVWYIAFALVGLGIESYVTITKNKGHEWKWFCPSVFFFLLSVVPAVWLLELRELSRRLELYRGVNITLASRLENQLSARFDGIGLHIAIPLSMTSDQWLRALEQLLLLFLILGRWLLPKGKLTHDQLSQLLLVYIGTAADIVEFFEAFKEEQVRYNTELCHAVLGIWSWSLVQFTLVLTAVKARRDQSGVLARLLRTDTATTCCSPDVYGIIISILLQDAPYLVFRLLLIFKYGVLSYTNMFFTCKNSLVIMLLLYRLIVVQIEGRRHPQTNGYRPKSLYHWDDFDTTVTIIEAKDNPYDIPVKYTLKRHYSLSQNGGNHVSIAPSKSNEKDFDCTKNRKENCIAN